MILYFLVGVVLAAGCFATLMWSFYQSVQTRGWRRAIHLALIAFLIAAFIPAVFSNGLLIAVVGFGLLGLSVAFVFANRWPTTLLSLPPALLALLMLSFPELLAVAA